MRQRQDTIRHGFTLVELMVAITIIAILATTILFGMAGVTNTAKVQRAKSQIARIHEILAEQWESYETRSVTFVGTPPTGNPQIDRLVGLRELIRLEMPDRVSDIQPRFALSGFPNPRPKSGIARPSRNLYFHNRAFALTKYTNWTIQHQGAECLYMILSQAQIGDSNGLEFFSEREIGDTDNDGMPEILDPWGNPIQFVRWAPGFKGPSSYQTGDTGGGPDAMDLASADPRLRDDDTTNDTYAIFPLVFSNGPDGEDNILTDFGKRRSDGTVESVLRFRDTDRTPFANNVPWRMSDPYCVWQGQQLGQLEDPNSTAHLDNIYNQALDTKL